MLKKFSHSYAITSYEGTDLHFLIPQPEISFHCQKMWQVPVYTPSFTVIVLTG